MKAPANTQPRFGLDGSTERVEVMAKMNGDELDPALESKYMGVVHRHTHAVNPLDRIDRPTVYTGALRKLRRLR